MSADLSLSILASSFVDIGIACWDLRTSEEKLRYRTFQGDRRGPPTVNSQSAAHADDNGRNEAIGGVGPTEKDQRASTPPAGRSLAGLDASSPPPRSPPAGPPTTIEYSASDLRKENSPKIHRKSSLTVSFPRAPWI